jgi:hydrogenase expression/formation protein HypC
MKIIQKNGSTAIAENSGVSLKVELMLVPDAAVGDYVLIHAGFALTVIDECEALATIALQSELEEGFGQ